LDIDLCLVIKNKNFEKLLTNLTKVIKKYVDVINKVPYAVNKNFYILKLKIS